MSRKRGYRYHMFSGVPLVGIGGVGRKFIIKSTRRARNQNQRSNFEVSSGSFTHLKSSLGRTRLGRLLGGGGLSALSSLTSFASFSGLRIGGDEFSSNGMRRRRRRNTG